MNLLYLSDLRDMSKLRLIRWLQRHNLLANPLFCGNCNNNMNLVRRDKGHVDGYLWRCVCCGRKKNLRTNSFFAEFPKKKLWDILAIVYFWSEDDQQGKTARKLSLSANLVSRVYRKLEDICSADIEKYPFFPFGGPNVILHCDESKFTHKSKYNRGRRSTNRSWVIGVVSTAFTPSRGYYKVVPRRNRQNIFPILEKCLRPGSILYTDDYTVYTNVQHLLPNHVSDHRIVNHSLNFVDQVTGVHTQNIESMWAKLKLPVKMRMGISRYDLQFYLDDRMWREWKGENDIFNNFITTLSLQYTNVPV